jgi:hypothetical protein
MALVINRNTRCVTRDVFLQNLQILKGKLLISAKITL